jgi:YidC/Oxa1 family membrane protein insertase
LKKGSVSRTIALMSSFFHTLFYQPLYNGLILLMDALPWFDAGVIIVLFTLLVKFALLPLSKKAVVAQIEMKRIEPELKKIKEKYKDDSQEQARRTMALYKERKINPFSSLVTTLIQLPIIFALYFVFLRSGLPVVNESLMYSFTPTPHTINMIFLGLINISNKSAILAVLAGLSSFFQIRFSMPAYKPSEGPASFKDDLSRSMNLQMRYIFPVIIFFISLKISGAVALYWVTSNLFTLAQEFFVLRKLRAA